MFSKKLVIFFAAIILGINSVCAQTCQSATCPNIAYTNTAVDPERNVQLIPRTAGYDNYLNGAASVANGILSGITGAQSNYGVGAATANSTPIGVTFVTDPHFFDDKPKLADCVGVTACLAKDSVDGYITKGEVYIDLTLQCGSGPCLNPQQPGFDTALTNLVAHEAFGHAWGLDDNSSLDSSMGPWSGVNNANSVDGFSDCDQSAIQARTTQMLTGNLPCYQ